MGTSFTLHLLLGPDERPQRNKRSLLLGRRPEAAIDSLPPQERRHSASYSGVCFKRVESMQRIQRLE